MVSFMLAGGRPDANARRAPVVAPRARTAIGCNPLLSRSTDTTESRSASIGGFKPTHCRQQVVVDVDHAPDDPIEQTFRDRLVEGTGHEVPDSPGREGRQRVQVAQDQDELPRHEIAIDRHRPTASTFRTTYFASLARNRR